MLRIDLCLLEMAPFSKVSLLVRNIMVEPSVVTVFSYTTSESSHCACSLYKVNIDSWLCIAGEAQ